MRLFVSPCMSWNTLIERLDSMLLGARITGFNRQLWVNPCGLNSEIPLDLQWNSANNRVLPVMHGALYLGGGVYCFQRGFFSEWAEVSEIWDQFIRISAVRFNHSAKDIDNILKPYAWDFLVVVLANVKPQSATVASGCLVEYRNSVDVTKAPYLYIGDLCTHLDYTGRKIATQICYGTYQLAYMISTGMATQREGVTQSREDGFLQPTGQLYVALMIKQADPRVYGRLISLYVGCGFRMDMLPECLYYGSSTVYSPFEYLDAVDTLKRGGDQCTAMYREVQEGVMFSYDGREILDPMLDTGREGVEFRYMYHSFPVEHLEFVRKHGLLIEKHGVLFSDCAYTPYVCTEVDGIFLEAGYCDNSRYAVFVVKARYFDEDMHIGCSLSSNLAVCIAPVNVFKQSTSCFDEKP